MRCRCLILLRSFNACHTQRITFSFRFLVVWSTCLLQDNALVSRTGPRTCPAAPGRFIPLSLPSCVPGHMTGRIHPNALYSPKRLRNSTTRINAGDGKDQISKGKIAKCVEKPWFTCHRAWRPSRLISCDQLALLGIQMRL